MFWSYALITTLVHTIKIYYNKVNIVIILVMITKK